jgi:hypothetical protein
MKKKRAIRPIQRTSPETARAVHAARSSGRGYPDARTLRAALCDVAARAIRIAAIPTTALLAGCASSDAPETFSADAQSWRDRIGTVVEGLRPPADDPPPLAGAQVPVQPEFVPPIQTELRPIPAPPPVQPDPIPSGGVVRPVEPPPPPEPEHRPPRPQGGARPVQPDPDPPEVVGLMGMVRSSLGPARLVHATPVPRTLSDEALAAALASIKT